MEGRIPDSDPEEADREAARRSQLDMTLNVFTNIPSNALVFLFVHAITIFMNSPVGEFATKPAYSLSKLHSVSNKAMAQTERQQVRTVHDGPLEQLGGPRGFEASPAVACVAGCTGEVEEAGGEGFVWLEVL